MAPPKAGTYNFEREIQAIKGMDDLEGDIRGRVAAFQRPEFSDPSIESVIQAMDGKLDGIDMDLWLASNAAIDNQDAQAIVADYARFMMRYDSGPGGAGTNRLYYKQTQGPEYELQPHWDWYHLSSREALGLFETKILHKLRCIGLELGWLNQIERYKVVLDGLPLEQISEVLQTDTVLDKNHVLPGIKPVPPALTVDFIERHVRYALSARKQAAAEELYDMRNDHLRAFYVPRDTAFELLDPGDLYMGMSLAEANELLAQQLMRAGQLPNENRLN